MSECPELLTMATGRRLPSFSDLGKARMISGLETTGRRTGIAGTTLGAARPAPVVLVDTVIESEIKHGDGMSE